MFVLNLAAEDLTEEDEIFFVGVRRKKRSLRRRKILKFRPRIQRIKPRFDDYFFEDHHSYSYENSGQYHDSDYQSYPSRSAGTQDPYEAPDPPHDDYIMDSQIDPFKPPSTRNLQHEGFVIREDPYKPPDPHYRNPPTEYHVHSDYDDVIEFTFEDNDLTPYSGPYFGTVYRTLHPPPPVIRNARDFRDFPGIEPAGVKGVTPRLLRFIRGRVVEVALSIQEERLHP